VSIVQRFICRIDSLDRKSLGEFSVVRQLELETLKSKPLESDNLKSKNSIIEYSGLKRKEGPCAFEPHTLKAEVSGLSGIPYVLPGELVEVEEHCYRQQTSFVVSRILEKSPNRADPPCKYFTICGGCSLQHLKTKPSNYYYQHKLQILKNSLKNRGIECYVDKVISTDAETSRDGNNAETYNVRRRVIFEAVKKCDQVFLGFKKYHSNQIVNIDSCLLLLPELSDLIEKLKNILEKILSDKEKCKILLTKAENGIDLIIEVDASFKILQEKIILIEEFCINNSIIKATIVADNKWNMVYFSQQPYVIFGDAKIAVNSYSFLQVSKISDSILAELISKVIGKVSLDLNKELKIIDLFCGRGTLTVPAAQFGKVDGFEIDKDSVKSLKDAAVYNINNLYVRNLFINPVGWDELSRYDVAIINPPRAGAKEQSKLLAQSMVKFIIYLSCDVESFARDAAIITQDKRYILKEITPIDQFYWSSHLEVFAVFLFCS